MFKSFYFYAMLFAALGLTLTSCSKDEEDPKPVESITSDILVDAKTDGEFVLFSFENNAVVALSQQQTNNGDFGLRLTTFITNSGVSGPGNGGAIVQTGIFDEINSAPENGYLTDAEGNLAITDGVWYDYNPITRSFSPKAGIVFFIRTGTGKYTKMEILEAVPTDDNGNIVAPPTIPTKIKYTFRYAYQSNGSRNF